MLRKLALLQKPPCSSYAPLQPGSHELAPPFFLNKLVTLELLHFPSKLIAELRQAGPSSLLCRGPARLPYGVRLTAFGMAEVVLLAALCGFGGLSVAYGAASPDAFGVKEGGSSPRFWQQPASMTEPAAAKEPSQPASQNVTKKGGVFGMFRKD